MFGHAETLSLDNFFALSHDHRAQIHATPYQLEDGDVLNTKPTCFSIFKPSVSVLGNYCFASASPPVAAELFVIVKPHQPRLRPRFKVKVLRDCSKC